MSSFSARDYIFFQECRLTLNARDTPWIDHGSFRYENSHQ